MDSNLPPVLTDDLTPQEREKQIELFKKDDELAAKRQKQGEALEIVGDVCGLISNILGNPI